MGGNTGSGIEIIGSGNLIINNCTISNNTADYGGGISNSGTLDITSSDIFRNCSFYYGGGGISNKGTLTITSSTISDNSAGDEAGGVYNDSTLTITGSTISGNDVSQRGGGIYLTGTGINTIGGNNASDTSNFNIFIDNKKDGIISAAQHIRNSTEDCHTDYPYNDYNPN